MATKKARKGTQSKRHGSARSAPAQKETRSRSFPWALALVALLFALLIAGIAYELMDTSGPQPASDAGETIVVVNGEPITQARLDFHYQLLPEPYRTTLSKEQVLEELVNEELIIQSAREEGIVASQEEIHARVQSILASSQLTPAELEQNLASFNVTTTQFEELISRQIALERYREVHLSLTPAPSQERIAERYEQQRAKYEVPERAVARHVLIRSEIDGAAVVAKQAYDDIVDGADFCTYVTNTSDDPGSKETCGEYTFPRGMMVPEFEDAAFGMEDGEIRLIQTQFGYHVIQRLRVEPAGELPLEDVSEAIESELRSEDSAAAFRDLIESLRAKATIEYPGATASATTGAVIGPAAPQPQETEVAPAAPVEAEPEAPEVDTEPAAPAEVPLEPEPVAPAENERAPVPAADAGSVLACVASRSTLYGTQWSSDSRDARRLFADARVELAYVACDGAGADACADIGVGAYPTWVIDGSRHVGRLSLEQLRRAASC